MRHWTASTGLQQGLATGLWRERVSYTFGAMSSITPPGPCPTGEWVTQTNALQQRHHNAFVVLSVDGASTGTTDGRLSLYAQQIGLQPAGADLIGAKGMLTAGSTPYQVDGDLQVQGGTYVL